MIQGVEVVPLRRIPDERGTIFHMLRATDPHFQKFGEIYFSTVYKGMSDPCAIVANGCTESHDPAPSTRLDPFNIDIPYDWNVREH